MQFNEVSNRLVLPGPQPETTVFRANTTLGPEENGADLGYYSPLRAFAKRSYRRWQMANGRCEQNRARLH